MGLAWELKEARERQQVQHGRVLRAPGALSVPEGRLPLSVLAISNRGFTRYRGTVYTPGQEFKIDPLDAPGLVRAGKIQVIENLPEPDWWGALGRVLTCEPGEAQVLASGPTVGALKIAQGCAYDPGNAVYRFHSSLGEHTKHASAFIRYITRTNNPFSCPWQVNAAKDPLLARALFLGADVVHSHVDFSPPRSVGLSMRPKQGQLLIRHYHGTQFNDNSGVQLPDRMQNVRQQAAFDDLWCAQLVGARLTLVALRPDRMSWLPIAVPVDRYRLMVTRSTDEWPRRPFRVAHSPTKAILKGTKDFQRVVKRLQSKGLAIQPVMIEWKSHTEALALKATCDACFDSFALGIQGSGLEAAAMGQPVIAGDPAVADLYRAEIGSVPYTFAPTWQQLEASLERLATDHDYYTSEAARVGAYVREYHDYPAVARRYEDILATALGRPNVRTKPRKRKAA